ncbi:MAG: thioredoxin-disulfide reductase [Alphaproteobacteria bacterium]|nr:thioredoxin-disulfide reductase [Alphaproteobacteria bacterium]
MTEHRTPVLVIGSGSAGCTAAIYAARANLKPIMVHGMQPGGQLTITTEVENYPGFAEAIQGPWLMEQMEAQAAHVGTQIFHDTIMSVDLSARPFKAVGDSGDIYYGDTLVIATGAKARWLGLESETKFQNFGVSACATCDGFFFKKKDVAVIGGGNSAVEEALYLAKICNSVTLIHRRDTLRAEKIAQDRLFATANVKVIWDSAVEEFLGSDQPPSLTGLRLKNTKTGEISEIKVDGAFVAIGHDPNTWLFKDQGIALDNEGYIVTTPGSTKTSVAGVFAAGDVQDKIFRQAITAAGTGCMAALEAQKFLEHEEAQAHANAA